MKRSARSLIAIVLALVALAAAAVPLAVARAADVSPASTGDDNVVVAINVEDGTTVFEFSLSLRRVADGTVDQTNVAAAVASCTDCTTVAVALQGVLVTRDADAVVPQNIAFTYNDQCVRCFSYASATQLVFGFDGPVRISADGRHRLHDVRRALSFVQDHAAELTAGQLVGFVEAVEAELMAILTEETMEVGRQAVSPSVPTTTITSATPEPQAATTADVGADEPTASSLPAAATTTSTPPAASTSASTTPDDLASGPTATTVPESTVGSTGTTTPGTAPVQPAAPEPVDSATAPDPVDTSTAAEPVDSATAPTPAPAPAPSEPPSTDSP